MEWAYEKGFSGGEGILVTVSDSVVCVAVQSGTARVFALVGTSRSAGEVIIVSIDSSELTIGTDTVGGLSNLNPMGW